MSKHLRIGLTGGIASGKSTAAQRFIELGVVVIDADVSARSVVAVGQPGLMKVVEHFGDTILEAGGELDRSALRRIIFADPERRRELESILHPLIKADMESRAIAAEGPYVVMDIPLLVEGGGTAASRRVDRILVVDVPEELQVERVIARDGTTHMEARAILAAQTSRELRLKAADDVIVNVGSVAELRHAVDALHDRYLHLAAQAPI